MVKAFPVIVRLPLWYTIVSTTRIWCSKECWSKSIKICVFRTSLNCSIPMLMLEMPILSKLKRSIKNFRTNTKFLVLMLADPSTTKKISWGSLLQSGDGPLGTPEWLKRDVIIWGYWPTLTSLKFHLTTLATHNIFVKNTMGWFSNGYIYEKQEVAL